MEGTYTTNEGELARRKARAPDYAAENRALVSLSQAQTVSRDDFLCELADAARSLCESSSAGVCLLDGSDTAQVFRWVAVAGLCSDLRNLTTTNQECPCGETVASGAPRLFIRPQARFACLHIPGVEIAEALLVPIAEHGRHLGVLWIFSLAGGRQFDAEDARLLSSLAKVAAGVLTVIELRDRATESELRREEFIAMLGHELRNPMAPIDSALSAAKRLPPGDARAHEVLTIAQRQMRQLRTLVDDLLDAARLKHGKLAIRHSDTSLNEIAFDALSGVRHHIEARKHTLVKKGIDAPIYVHADHVRLSQVLGNLLSNAAKYTPIGGHIELDVQVEENLRGGTSKTAVIQVKDNGVGLDPSTTAGLFELFAQTPSNRTGAGGGLGIGLAVAKRLVELHEGSISIESAGLGQGTVVTLRLPIVHEAPPALYAAEDTDATLTSHASILLVDDNVDALRALHTLLELDGHEVTSCDNGPDAIRLMRELQPEIGIVDVGMPGMDGFEVARVVREDSSISNTILVALTGYGSESDKSRALAAGFDYHLTKPLSFEKLGYILSNRRDGRPGGLV